MRSPKTRDLDLRCAGGRCQDTKADCTDVRLHSGSRSSDRAPGSQDHTGSKRWRNCRNGTGSQLLPTSTTQSAVATACSRLGSDSHNLLWHLVSCLQYRPGRERRCSDAWSRATHSGSNLLLARDLNNRPTTVEQEKNRYQTHDCD